MRKIIIGLLALGSVSANASTCTYESVMPIGYSDVNSPLISKKLIVTLKESGCVESEAKSGSNHLKISTELYSNDGVVGSEIVAIKRFRARTTITSSDSNTSLYSEGRSLAVNTSTAGLKDEIEIDRFNKAERRAIQKAQDEAAEMVLLLLNN